MSSPGYDHPRTTCASRSALTEFFSTHEHFFQRLDSFAVCGLAAIWAAYLLVPFPFLKGYRIHFLGNLHPTYYLLTVPPVVAISIYAIIRRQSEFSRWIAWWWLPCLLLVGVLLSHNRFWSFRELMSWIVRGFAVGGSFYLLLRERQARILIVGVYFLAIIAAIIGLREIFFKVQLHPKFLIGYGIVNGTQGNRIPYTSFLVAFVPLAVWQMQFLRINYALRIATLLILLLLLSLTITRSAWFAAFLSVSLYIRLMGKKERQIAVKAIAAAMVIVLPFLLGSKRNEIISRVVALNFKAPGVYHRLESYHTLRCLSGHWLFGAGYGQYPTECHQYYIGPDAQTIVTPDNQYLRWIEENGIVGAIALIAFLGLVIARGLQSLESLTDTSDIYMYKAVLCGFIGIATTFVFFDGFYWGACNMTFWALLGILSAPSQRDIQSGA